MPGTLVQDASAPNLATGATLNAAGTTNGTIQELNSPGKCRVRLATATVTGTNPTLDVEIQSSNSATFASGVTSHGRFAQVGAASNAERFLNAFINKRYVRAVVVVGGTSPSYAGTTIRVVEPHLRRTDSDTA